MAVKEYRKRYVVFQIDAPRIVQRWELIGAIQKIATRMEIETEGVQRPWLTAFDDNRGILRCAHTDKDKAIEMLTSVTEIGDENMPVQITTLKTSGTIKKAKEAI